MDNSSPQPVDLNTPNVESTNMESTNMESPEVMDESGPTANLDSVRPTRDPHARPVISISNLTKIYGSLRAVDGLNLEIPEGAIFGLIGPNGAGKSTTFSVLAGLLKPSSGDVSVLGFDPTSQGKDVKKRLGYMPDVLGHYDSLTVEEYLRFFAGAYRIPKSKTDGLISDLLELVDLSVKRDDMVNDLSRGMKQRLSLARALVHDPSVLILDEPASGLDPRARIDLRALLLQLQAMGKTLVVSSHILAELEEMCTDIAILEAGKLLAAGPPNEILAAMNKTRTVKVTFLGGGTEVFAAPDEGAQAQLLRRLVVEEGRDVTEFSVDTTGLEQLFMEVTKGIVQ